jgi:hypothetical protein
LILSFMSGPQSFFDLPASAKRLVERHERYVELGFRLCHALDRVDANTLGIQDREEIGCAVIEAQTRELRRAVAGASSFLEQPLRHNV